MNKEKLLNYLKTRKEDLEKQYEENVNLDDRCISKEKLVSSTSKALEEIRNLKSLIECGLLDNCENGFVDYMKYKNGKYVGHGSCLENKWDMVCKNETINGYEIRRV